MRTNEYFDENGWFKSEYLWKLRQEIALGSIYISDYENSFGIAPAKVCDFFTSFWEGHCEALAKEEKLREQAVRLVDERISETAAQVSESVIENYRNAAYTELQFDKYDNKETLLEYYESLDGECPLPPTYINVDIHMDYVRSVRVIAASECEAESVVDEMIRNNEIPNDTFKSTGDYELDTNW